MSPRREVTRALCWLPPQPCPWSQAADHVSDEYGTWSRTETRRQLIGRIGYLVITEILDLPGWPRQPDLRLTELGDMTRIRNRNPYQENRS